MTRYARYGGSWVDLCPASTFRLPPDDPTLHPINATYGDEMDSVPLDAAWTKRNIGTSEVLVPASTYFSAGTTVLFDAQGDAILRAAPSGDFEIVAGFKGDEFGGMTGLCILDSIGTGAAYSPYNDGNTYMWAITTYNYAASGPNNGARPAANMVYWLSLKKVGTNYTGRFSADGINWTGFTSNLSSGITPAKIGVLRAFTSGGTSGTFTIYRFNVYPSPTFYVP